MGASNRHKRHFSLQALVFAAIFAFTFFPHTAKAQNPDAGDVTTGLVGHWKLDETSTGPAVDSTGNNNAGSNGGWDFAIGSVEGKITRGYDTRIGGGYLTASNIADYNTDQVTLSAWVNVDDNGNSQNIVRKGVGSTGWAFRIDTSGELSLGIYGQATLRSTGTIQRNQWQHVAVTYDNVTLDANFYINGQNVGTDTGGTPGNLTGDTSNMGWVWSSFPLTGIIDDARIYNRVLTADDIALLAASFPGVMPCNTSYEAVMIFNQDEKVMQYCNGTDWVSMAKTAPGAPTDGLVHHWPLDEITLTGGSTITDIVGSADGTVVGTLTSVPSPSGTGIQVDANNEYVDAGVISALEGQSQFTLSGWVKRDAANQRVMFGRYNGGEGTYFDFWNDNNGYFANHDGTGTTYCEGYVSNADTASTNTDWQHVTLVYDGTQSGNTNRIKGYINGSQVTFDAFYNGGCTIPATSSSTSLDFRIGNLNGLSLSRGSLDDIRIYDRPLSDSEVMDLYTGTNTSSISYTGCTSPIGKAGEVDYNLDEGVMQYCNGANWIAMGPKIAEAGSSADDLSPSAPANGLIGHWTLDETSGTTINDSSGNGNNGTYSGEAAIPSVNGHINTGIRFDGSDDVAVIPDDPLFDTITDSITISVWVNKQSALGGWRSIFARPLGTSYLDSWALFYLPSQNYTFYHNLLGSHQNIDSGVDSDADIGIWTNIAVTYDGTTLIMYRNGEEMNRQTVSGGAFANVDTDISIGADTSDNGATYTENANAYIDDARVYNRALSPDEIVDLYRSSSLVGHWTLDETSGTTAADSSGNGNDGTVSGTDFDTDSAPAVSGRGLQFDGTDDEIEIPASPSLQPADALTLASWVKFQALNGTYNVIIAKQVGTGTGDHRNSYTILYEDSVNELRGFAGNGSSFTGLTASFTPVPNTWYHVAYTYNDAANNHKLYLDGVEIANGTNNDALEYNSAPITLGFDYEDEALTNNSWHFNSVLDDTRIYNRALSASEVANLYALTGGGSAPVTGCTTIGEVCDDGSVYAGLSPDGGVPMYTTPTDQSTSPGVIWDAAGFGASPSGYTDVNTGRAHQTDAEANLTLTDFPAFELCANLSFGGYNDWYLPALEELNILYTNNVAIGGFVTAPATIADTAYWSSTDPSNFSSYAAAIAFSNGAYRTANGGEVSKVDTNHVRCVRKGSSAIGGTCSNPRGIAGELIYNDDHTIMQYCNGSEWVGIGSSN